MTTNATMVRAWARNSGFTIGDRGRLPALVLDAFDKAHPGSSTQVSSKTATKGAPAVGKARRSGQVSSTRAKAVSRADTALPAKTLPVKVTRAKRASAAAPVSKAPSGKRLNESVRAEQVTTSLSKPATPPRRTPGQELAALVETVILDRLAALENQVVDLVSRVAVLENTSTSGRAPASTSAKPARKVSRRQ